MDDGNNATRKKGGKIKVFFSVPQKKLKELHVLLEDVDMRSVCFHKETKNNHSDHRTGRTRIRKTANPSVGSSFVSQKSCIYVG